MASDGCVLRLKVKTRTVERRLRRFGSHRLMVGGTWCEGTWHKRQLYRTTDRHVRSIGEKTLVKPVHVLQVISAFGDRLASQMRLRIEKTSQQSRVNTITNITTARPNMATSPPAADRRYGLQDAICQHIHQQTPSTRRRGRVSPLFSATPKATSPSLASHIGAPHTTSKRTPRSIGRTPANFFFPMARNLAKSAESHPGFVRRRVVWQCCLSPSAPPHASSLGGWAPYSWPSRSCRPVVPLAARHLGSERGGKQENTNTKSIVTGGHAAVQGESSSGGSRSKTGNRKKKRGQMDVEGCEIECRAAGSTVLSHIGHFGGDWPRHRRAERREGRAGVVSFCCLLLQCYGGCIPTAWASARASRRAGNATLETGQKSNSMLAQYLELAFRGGRRASGWRVADDACRLASVWSLRSIARRSSLRCNMTDGTRNE